MKKYLILILLLFLPITCFAELSHDAALAQANTLVQKKEFRQAQQLLEDLIHKTPQDLEIKIRLATYYAWENKFNLALEKLDTLNKNNPNNLEILLLLCRVNRWNNNYQNAQHFLNQAQKIDAKNKEVITEVSQIKAFFNSNYSSGLKYLETFDIDALTQNQNKKYYELSLQTSFNKNLDSANSLKTFLYYQNQLQLNTTTNLNDYNFNQIILGGHWLNRWPTLFNSKIILEFHSIQKLLNAFYPLASNQNRIVSGLSLDKKIDNHYFTLYLLDELYASQRSANTQIYNLVYYGLNYNHRYAYNSFYGFDLADYYYESSASKRLHLKLWGNKNNFYDSGLWTEYIFKYVTNPNESTHSLEINKKIDFASKFWAKPKYRITFNSLKNNLAHTIGLLNKYTLNNKDNLVCDLEYNIESYNSQNLNAFYLIFYYNFVF
jgi:hypothetical protein